MKDAREFTPDLEELKARIEDLGRIVPAFLERSVEVDEFNEKSQRCTISTYG